MSKKKNKYYVVWKGYNPGIYNSWEKCKEQIHGYQGAVYKGYPDLKSATEAFESDYSTQIGKNASNKKIDEALLKKAGAPVMESISVDAACNTVTKEMEYQGVKTDTGEVLFKKGPFEGGSNNIGEFLALVHALAYCKKENINTPIYSDSNSAIKWVKQKKTNTSVVKTQNNEQLFDLIERAEKWLQENHWNNEILKWETAAWGEIPADFGRK